MLSINVGENTFNARLETSYTSLSSTETMRSPRTPTYVPDSPSTRFVVPFDHARHLSDSSTGSENWIRMEPPPDVPTAWVWTCHLCHSKYPLGVTRRCLVDGHYYCSGETNRPSLRKRKRKSACSSEFDYAAWNEWGEWRREVLSRMKNAQVLNGCDKCDFPSQCRSRHLELVDSRMSSTAAVAPSISTQRPKKGSREKRDNGTKISISNQSVDFDQILSSICADNTSTPKGSRKSTKGSSGGTKKMGDATSRKSGTGKILMPSLEEEIARETAKLQELVGPDLWAALEDVDLEIADAE